MRSLDLRSVRAAWRQLGGLGLLCALFCALPFVGAAVVAATTGTWLPWFAARDAAAAAGFVAIAALAAGLSLVPSYAVGAAAGFVFGAGPGTVMALFAITAAAWLGRALAAPLVGDRLLRFVDARPRAREVFAALLGATPDRAGGVLGTAPGTATTVVTLVRLAPVTPFAATNLLMAAARTATVPYLAGTVLGLGPRTALAAVAGAGLAELRLGADRGAAALAFAAVSLAVAVLGAAAVARARLRARARVGVPPR